MYIQQAIIKIYSPSDTIINAYDAFTYYSNLTDIEFEIRKEFEEDIIIFNNKTLNTKYKLEGLTKKEAKKK